MSYCSVVISNIANAIMNTCSRFCIVFDEAFAFYCQSGTSSPVRKSVASMITIVDVSRSIYLGFCHFRESSLSNDKNGRDITASWRHNIVP